MAGVLQPIGMISAMLERRLQGASPDLGKLGKNASDIGELSREAASSCMNLMTWLAPRGGYALELHSGLVRPLPLPPTARSFTWSTLVTSAAAASTPGRHGTRPTFNPPPL